MCPACIASAALIAGGAASMVGLTTLIVKFRSKTAIKSVQTQAKLKEKTP